MSERDDHERALASTAVSEDERSPSQQALHDDVKEALFSGRKLEYEPGTVLASRYRVVALLGRGGMGEVYRARDLIVDEDVAIKFLPSRLAERPAYLERFVQEVRLARQVSHPNVCRVHDIAEADGRRFISMEYIDGEDLASLLRRIGRLGHDKALELAHQLCSGLAALHERGMIHRDLKPANVMLDGKGHIRIADFGLASVAAELRKEEYRDGTPRVSGPRADRRTRGHDAERRVRDRAGAARDVPRATARRLDPRRRHRTVRTRPRRRRGARAVPRGGPAAPPRVGARGRGRATGWRSAERGAGRRTHAFPGGGGERGDGGRAVASGGVDPAIADACRDVHDRRARVRDDGAEQQRRRSATGGSGAPRDGDPADGRLQPGLQRRRSPAPRARSRLSASPCRGRRARGDARRLGVRRDRPALPRLSDPPLNAVDA